MRTRYFGIVVTAALLLANLIWVYFKVPEFKDGPIQT